MQLNCGFFGFLLFFCRLKILCVWICCVVSRIKSHLYICALHISIVAVSPLSCDAAEDTLLCCPHNKVEKEKLGYFTLKTLCMESTHNGVVFSWDSLRSLSSLSFQFSLFFLESFFFLTPVMFFFYASWWVVTFSELSIRVSICLSFCPILVSTVSQRSLGGELFQIWTQSRTYDDAFAHIWLLGWSVLFLYIHIYTHTHIFWTESRTKGCDVRIFSAADGPKPHCHRMWSFFATAFCIWL